MVRITRATIICGQTSGRVIWRNMSHPLAPSRRAASYGSWGRDARPPSTISITNGVHCQVSTITSVGITVLALYDHSDGGNPTLVSR